MTSRRAAVHAQFDRMVDPQIDKPRAHLPSSVRLQSSWMEILTTIGVDAHGQVPVATAVDGQGRVLAEDSTRGRPRQNLTVSSPGCSPRQVRASSGVEGGKGYGRMLRQRLMSAGESVVNVATNLTAEGRRRSRRPGKDDEGDAGVISRSTSRPGSGTGWTRCSRVDAWLSSGDRGPDRPERVAPGSEPGAEGPSQRPGTGKLALAAI